MSDNTVGVYLYKEGRLRASSTATYPIVARETSMGFARRSVDDLLEFIDDGDMCRLELRSAGNTEAKRNLVVREETKQHELEAVCHDLLLEWRKDRQ